MSCRDSYDAYTCSKSYRHSVTFINGSAYSLIQTGDFMCHLLSNEIKLLGVVR